MYKPPLIEPDAVSDFFNKTVKDELDKVMDPIMKPLNDIFKQVKDITDIFKTIPDRIKSISGGFDDLGNAVPQAFGVLGSNLKAGFAGFDKTFIDSFAKLGTDFKDGGKLINAGVSDEVDVINTEVGGLFADIGKFIASFKKVFQYIHDFFSDFVMSYIKCGMTKIHNIHKCFFYYILEAIGQLLYLPARIVIYVINLYAGIDLQEIVDEIWNFIYNIDDIIKSIIGFSLIHYPQDVLDSCYLCKVSPMPKFPKQDFIDQCLNIQSRINKLPSQLAQPIDTEITPGVNKIINAVPSTFTTFGNDMQAAVDKIQDAFDQSNKVYNKASGQGAARIGSAFKTHYDYDVAGQKQIIDTYIREHTPA